MSTVVESTVSLSRTSAGRPAEAPRGDRFLAFDAVLQGSRGFSTSPTLSRTPLPTGNHYRPVTSPDEGVSEAPAASSERAADEPSTAEESSASGAAVHAAASESGAQEDTSADGREDSSEAAAESGGTEDSAEGPGGEAASHDKSLDGAQVAPGRHGSPDESAVGSDEGGQDAAVQTNPFAVGPPAGEGDSADGPSPQAGSEKADGHRQVGRTQAGDGTEDSLPAKHNDRLTKSVQKDAGGVDGADEAARRTVDVQPARPTRVLDEENADGTDPATAVRSQRRASRQTQATTTRTERATDQQVEAKSALPESDPETARQRTSISPPAIASLAVTEISAGDRTADEASKSADSGARLDATEPSAGVGSREDASGRLNTTTRTESEAASGRGPLGPGEAHRFVQRVSRAMELAAQRGEVLQIRLSPPELGSLRVEIAIRAGVLTAHLEADSAAARAALLDNLPVLRDRLAEQDIRIERFEVDVREDAEGRGRERSPAFQFREPRGDGAVPTARRRPNAVSAGQPEPAVRTRLAAWIGQGQLNLLV